MPPAAAKRTRSRGRLAHGTARGLVTSAATAGQTGRPSTSPAESIRKSKIFDRGFRGYTCGHLKSIRRIRAISGKTPFRPTGGTMPLDLGPRPAGELLASDAARERTPCSWYYSVKFFAEPRPILKDDCHLMDDKQIGLFSRETAPNNTSSCPMKAARNRVCRCEPGLAGAAIRRKFQMEGHVAALLAMTNHVHRPFTQPPGVGPAIAMTNVEKFRTLVSRRPVIS